MIGNPSLDNKFIVSTIDTIKKYAPYIAIAFSVLVLMYGIYRGLSNNVQVYIAPPSILSVEKVPVFRYIEIKIKISFLKSKPHYIKSKFATNIIFIA